MTPAQLDHLRLLKAHLETLLEGAKKRTPVEWYAEDPYESFCGNPFCSVNGCPENHPSGEIILNGPEYDGFQDSELRMHPKDAVFIASCAGNAEAGWKSTLVAVEMALKFPFADADLGEAILAAWPIETFKP